MVQLVGSCYTDMSRCTVNKTLKMENLFSIKLSLESVGTCHCLLALLTIATNNSYIMIDS